MLMDGKTRLKATIIDGNESICKEEVCVWGELLIVLSQIDQNICILHRFEVHYRRA